MRLTYDSNFDAYVCECRYDEKETPKRCGFLYNSVVAKRWATKFTDNAVKLFHVADDDARERLKNLAAQRVTQKQASMATDAAIDVPAPDGLSYLPYQRGGIKYLSEHPNTLLADEMGLGKTIQILGLINLDATICSALIVCPASLRINWLREAEKWLLRPFKYYVVDSNAPVPADATFIIVNFARLKCSIIKGERQEDGTVTMGSAEYGDVVTSLLKRNFDLVAVDEAHNIKNPKARQTKIVLGQAAKPKKGEPAVLGLADLGKRLVFATGTPLQNRPAEMFPLLNKLAPATFPNSFKFGLRYCGGEKRSIGFGKNKRDIWTFDGATNMEELNDKLRTTVMIRRLKKDVLKELPPKRRSLVVFPNDGLVEVDEEARMYSAHEDRMIELKARTVLAGAAGSKEEYDRAVSVLEVAQEIAFNEMSVARHNLAVAKLPMCLEWLDDFRASAPDRKRIEFAHHKDVIAGICKHLGETATTLTGDTKMEDRQAAVDRFQAPGMACTDFVASIKAAGVGLTLTRANAVIFFELDWVPANMSQAEDRAHRIGQTEPVDVYHLVVDGSLDQKMAAMVIAKQEIADKALDGAGLAEQSADAVVVQLNAARGEQIDYSAKEKIPLYNADQLRLAVSALRILATSCDGAKEIDGMGFNKLDAFVGRSLAARETYTPGQYLLATKLARKYRRQLPSSIREGLGLDVNREKGQ